MNTLEAATVSELYPKILSHVLENGEPVSPRDRETLEVSPFTFVISDASECLVRQKARRLNYAYVIAERLSLLTGASDPDMLCFYIRKLREFVNPESGCFDGAYGPRVSRQLEFVLAELQRDPSSRRAVLVLYSELDHQASSVDVPCTLALHFMMRRGVLDLIVHMRSSDLYLGLPYDVSQFGFLQQVMAGWLGVHAGRYIQTADSAHIYSEDLEKVRELIANGDRLVPMQLDAPRLSYPETSAQAQLLLNLERDVRRGIPDAGLESDPRFHELAPEFKVYASCLSSYANHRRAQAVQVALEIGSLR